MNIGIISYITHSSHLNYGATLHGYAFQKYLKKKYNLDTKILRYIPKALSGENQKYPFLNRITNPFNQNQKWYVYIAKRLLQRINYLMQFNDNIKKWKNFKKFINNRLSTTIHTYTYNSLLDSHHIDDTNFDMFICEADVIWKFNSVDEIDENFFLNFPAAKNRIKIAYAPSISSKPFQGELMNKFTELIQEFSGISCRDRKGSEYLTQILNKPIPHVLDPTLLLDADEYSKLAIEPKEKNDYLLIYNCSSDDTKMVRLACKYAKKMNLKPIEISNYAINRLMMNHKVINHAGIEEWLGYFKNAKFVICNSFHGICFSIIFKKNFFVFQRDNSDFRIPGIMNDFQLSNRMIPYDNKAIPDEISEINWDNVYNNLAQMQNKSDIFIKTILQ